MREMRVRAGWNLVTFRMIPLQRVHSNNVVNKHIALIAMFGYRRREAQC